MGFLLYAGMEINLLAKGERSAMTARKQKQSHRLIVGVRGGEESEGEESEVVGDVGKDRGG